VREWRLQKNTAQLETWAVSIARHSVKSAWRSNPHAGRGRSMAHSFPSRFHPASPRPVPTPFPCPRFPRTWRMCPRGQARPARLLPRRKGARVHGDGLGHGSVSGPHAPRPHVELQRGGGGGQRRGRHHSAAGVGVGPGGPARRGCGGRGVRAGQLPRPRVGCGAVHGWVVVLAGLSRARGKRGGGPMVHSSAVQCSAVQCSAVQCSAVQCSAVQRSAVQHREMGARPCVTAWLAHRSPT
jgi:hypothetical protein